MSSPLKAAQFIRAWEFGGEKLNGASLRARSTPAGLVHWALGDYLARALLLALGKARTATATIASSRTQLTVQLCSADVDLATLVCHCLPSLCGMLQGLQLTRQPESCVSHAASKGRQ
jgi:hypothetical protein